MGPPVGLRPPHHFVQRPLGGRHPAFGREQRCRDVQILGVFDRIAESAAELADLVHLAPCQHQLAAGHADLGASAERQRPERAIAGCFGLGDRLIGLRQRAVERALLPIGDPQIVAALRDALSQTRPVESGNRDFPRPDGFRVAPPQVADDPQVVGGPTGRGVITVPAGDHERLREVVRRFIDPPADEGNGTACIEGVTLDRALLQLARLMYRAVQPEQAFIMPPEPRLRGPVQQGEIGRILELGPRPRAQVLDERSVLAGHGELPGVIDYECRWHRGYLLSAPPLP